MAARYPGPARANRIEVRALSNLLRILYGLSELLQPQHTPAGL